jgi:uncharacterized protein with HEPN domain
MQRDDLVYLRHIFDTARKAVEKVHGRLRSDLDEDEDFRDALAHRVQIIGEAASRLSEAFRAAHPEVPWHRVTNQ